MGSWEVGSHPPFQAAVYSRALPAFSPTCRGFSCGSYFLLLPTPYIHLPRVELWLCIDGRRGGSARWLELFGGRVRGGLLHV